jgi:DNA-binding IclR family transcriptional regulator
MNGAVRTAEVLTLLATRGRPEPVALIVRECGIPRSTAYEILKSLAAAGFAEPVEGGYKARERARELSGGVTIASALTLVESFDQAATALTTAELCRRSSLPLARVELLLRDLFATRLITRSGETVTLGVRLAALAARSGPLHRLRTAARRSSFSCATRLGRRRTWSSATVTQRSTSTRSRL